MAFTSPAFVSFYCFSDLVLAVFRHNNAPHSVVSNFYFFECLPYGEHIMFYNSPFCMGKGSVKFIEAGEIRFVLSAAAISHGVSHISYRVAVFHPSEGRIPLGLLPIFCSSSF